MTDADKLNLKTRAQGKYYSVIGTYEEGESMQLSGINDGDSVTLEYDGERILVERVQENEDHYSGVIQGFEASISIEYRELKIRSPITFREVHVIACARR